MSACQTPIIVALDFPTREAALKLADQLDPTLCRVKVGKELFTSCASDIVATLREREVARVGTEMAESKGLPFRAATDGENVSGKFTGTVQLSSGKFAVVEKSHEFTLVPWRPVIDRQLGREVMGVVQGGSVSWQFGRRHDLGL